MDFIPWSDCSGIFWAVLAAMRLCRIKVEVPVPDELDGFRVGLGGIGGAAFCRCGGGNIGGDAELVALRGGSNGGALTGGREAKNGFRFSSLSFFVRVAEEVLGARTPFEGEGRGTVCAGDRRPSSSLMTEPW